MERLVLTLKWGIFLGLLALLVVGAFLVGGEMPHRTVVVTPTLPYTSTVTPTATLTPTPSATPTLPPTWTPTSTPTLTPTPSPTLTPTETPAPQTLPAPPKILSGTTVVTSTLPQPTPMPHIAQPKGTINILVLGSDRRPGEKIARTDVLLIVSVFPDVPSASMISIPRDYYAWIPTWGLDKINTAYLHGFSQKYPGGGPALLKATIEYNFGIPIHYYALVDFNGYRSVVDAVGGVDIVVECPFHDTYLDDESPTGQTDIDLEPGVHHLDGKYALWYVRSRWSTSDFDRHRRQQQVLIAIFRRAKSQNLLGQIPALWDAYQQTVETDMPLPEMLYLGSLAAKMDMRDIKSRFVRGSRLLEGWRAPNGGAVLVPHYDALYDFMREAVQPPVTSRAGQRAYRVAVWNGSGHAGWGDVAAYRLGMEGFAVTEVQDVAAIPHTQVEDFTTTSKGSPLYKLLRLYHLQQSEIKSQPTEGSPIEFRVTLGQDYNPCLGTGTARWRPTPTPSPLPTATP